MADRTVEYFRELLTDSLDEHGLKATPEQVLAIAKDVAGAHENFGMAFGHDAIPSPAIAERKRLDEQHKYEVKRLEIEAAAYKREACELAGKDPHDVWVSDGQVYCWRNR